MVVIVLFLVAALKIWGWFSLSFIEREREYQQSRLDAAGPQASAFYEQAPEPTKGPGGGISTGAWKLNEYQMPDLTLFEGDQ